MISAVGHGKLAGGDRETARRGEGRGAGTCVAAVCQSAAEASLSGFLSPDELGSLDTLAKKLGDQTDTRVTIIALDGTVLGDSEEDPATMENHADRPEVMDALATGVGESTRYSTTLEQEMMYVAVPISYQDEILGIARVSLPLTAVAISRYFSSST